MQKRKLLNTFIYCLQETYHMLQNIASVSYFVAFQGSDSASEKERAVY